jgi:hypothetical protein
MSLFVGEGAANGDSFSVKTTGNPVVGAMVSGGDLSDDRGVMKPTKNLILGVLSCLLLGVGLANVNGNFKSCVSATTTLSPLEYLAGLPIPEPGGDGPKFTLVQPA